MKGITLNRQHLPHEWHELIHVPDKELDKLTRLLRCLIAFH